VQTHEQLYIIDYARALVIIYIYFPMKTNEVIKDITYNVCGTLIDLLLWQVFLVGASIGKSGPRGVHEAFREADNILQKVNHRTLSATWYQLTKKRLLTYNKRKNIFTAEITNFGKKRLLQKFPQYYQKRPWDKKIYLITYDIQTKANTKRDKLRRFLNQIGCKLLQESVYLTPYNPRQIISEFDNKYKIPGTIIVSDMGQDGGIGETDIKDVLVKLYTLESVNDRYEKFIATSKKKNIVLKSLMFEYLSILKDDPQLPFNLLPEGWYGDKAYNIYEKLKSQYVLSMSHVRR